ncbi:MAG: chromatin protein Cren7 [Candidatus Bathyarchaeota archaeon]|nr:chromatin protein Cren7 [Candidatus Bathyarchaeota archaeon]
MPKKRENCRPECGEIATNPNKTWELVAPFPDKKMRITIAIFGMFSCPSCGKNFRGLVSKAKLGAEGIKV